MSLEYVRETYKVPAKKGARIEYTYLEPHRKGTITGASDGWLLIKLDGDKNSLPYHPTWEITYLEGEG